MLFRSPEYIKSCAERKKRMDIPSLSMGLAQSRTLNEVGTAMLAKSLDNLESTGAQMVNMMTTSMELSVNPAVGANIDVYL